MVATGGPALDGSSKPSHSTNRIGADATDSWMRPSAQRSSRVEAAGKTLPVNVPSGVATLALKKSSSFLRGQLMPSANRLPIAGNPQTVEVRTTATQIATLRVREVTRATPGHRCADMTHFCAMSHRRPQVARANALAGLHRKSGYRPGRLWCAAERKRIRPVDVFALAGTNGAVPVEHLACRFEPKHRFQLVPRKV